MLDRLLTTADNHEFELVELVNAHARSFAYH